MSILGVLVDLQTISIAGSAADGVQVSHLNHSLPATNPEFAIMALLSVEAVGANGPTDLPVLFSPGGNASFLTFGYAISSSPSVPTLAFEAAAIVFHSLIR